MKSLILTLAFLTTSAVFAQTEQTNQSVFSKSQKFDKEGVELYDSNYELKKYKKLGLGIATGGLTGGLGLNLEVNIQPEDALTFGIGAGKAYNSFHIGWKHNYEAAYLSPYTKVGYANWFNSNSTSESASSNDILNRVLTKNQIKENKFSANFLAAGMGLEYNQLEGDLAGVNFFGELMVLGELNSSIYLPTAGLGVTYFY
ncbi:hypothetical protein CIK05_15540 [Bdellovibrio sp. qaytius]|nr:hypothetical protein CIK05_15540 [Bdellovibrio sp. qaytius]